MTADPEMAAAERAVIETSITRYQVWCGYAMTKGTAYIQKNGTVVESHPLAGDLAGAVAASNAAVAALIALRATRGLP